MARPKDPAEALLAGLLTENSRRAYAQDMGLFKAWIAARDLALAEVTRDDMTAYREHLRRAYAPATVNRRLTVVRQLLREAEERGIIAGNPARGVKGLRMNCNYSPTLGLTRQQAKALLAEVNRATLQGKRDYALLSLLLRTGLRRAEASALTVADLGEREGCHVLHVMGKGGLERLVKVPADVQGHLAEWLEAAEITEGPLFREVRRGHHLGAAKPLTGRGIAKVVLRYTASLGLEGISPHSLRHTFITLALAAGADLYKVQKAAGHADPRTTERYDRQRDDLANNAVDYVKL